MPTVLDWNPAADPDGFVGPVRDALAAGRAAVVPGDAGYVALVAADAPAAAGVVAAGASAPAVLAFGPDDAARLGLTVSVAAVRLMNRVWPGPLTVALPTGPGFTPSTGWPDAVAADGAVRFRYPDHPLFDALLPALTSPVLVVDTFAAAGADAATMIGDAAAVVVNAGDQGGRPKPTVVRCGPDGWAVDEAGAFPRADLDELAGRLILFVCTGNTCRSPMAEALAKRLLADRLGCRPDELPARGWWVMSAGVMAYPGAAATPDAVSATAEMGAELAGHASRPVNPQILAAADEVVAMTAAHAAALEVRYPGYGPTPRLLCGADDLPDPIGGDAAVYRACAGTIRVHIERLLAEWMGS